MQRPRNAALAEFRDVLRCPACRALLVVDDAGATDLVCTSGGERYPIGPPPDLRLRAPHRVTHDTVIPPVRDASPRPPGPIPHRQGGPVIAVEDEPGHLDGGNGMTSELMSWLPPGPGRLLDMGCGSRRTERVLRRTGLDYLGMDIGGDKPDLIGQGEALPLADASFDAVFTLASLAYTSNPFVACQELFRVLKPGGVFLGTTQFMEPCNGSSHHNVTYLGLFDWMRASGFDVLHVEANVSWSGLGAMCELQYLPGVPRRVKRPVVAILDRLHRSQATRRQQVRPAPVGEGPDEATSGGFRWVARRPPQ